MKLTLGFSPCPNDTFIFDALVNKKMDTEGLEFEAVLEDVETLNKGALQGRLDITKLSFPAFFQSLDNYVLLDSGSALGKGVGPLLISDNAQGLSNEDVKGHCVALPGEHTTANLLFSFAFPEAVNKKFMLFSEVEDAVINGECGLGVVIHENRFTYQQRGLHKIMDLGEHWESKMQTPVPLGGIAVKRSLDKTVSKKVEKFIRKSLEQSFANYPLVSDYVKQHSQTMSEDVMRQHIDLYVNNYSLALGDAGKHAIKSMYEVFLKSNNQGPADVDILFL